MYHAFCWHALFVRDHSFSVKIFDRSRSGCQLDWRRETIRAWAFRAGAPSPLASLPLARSFFLAPTTSKRLNMMLLRQAWIRKFAGICWILWSGLLPSLPDKQKTRVKFWEASKGLTFSEKTVTLNHMQVIGRFDWLSVRIGKTSVRLNRVCSFIIRSTFWDKLPWNTAEIRIWNMNQGLFVWAFLLCFS